MLDTRAICAGLLASLINAKDRKCIVRQESRYKKTFF